LGSEKEGGKKEKKEGLSTQHSTGMLEKGKEEGEKEKKGAQ